jgi:hypothetical protein
MEALKNYLTEDELAGELKRKTGKGTSRMLRQWRQRRIGPPWMKAGKIILYPNDGFEAWLRSQVQLPARSSRGAKS